MPLNPEFESKFGEEREEEMEEKSREEKEKDWENIQKEVEKTADTLGYKIDKKIKETTVAFQAMELPTSASCEGHLDHGISAPWVEVSAPNEPEERFVGEKEIYQKVAEKYQTTYEKVKRAVHKKAWKEALKESSKAEETPEYQKWRKENQKLIEKARTLLEEFYKEREVPENVRLIVDVAGEGHFRIHNGGKDYRPVEGLSEDEKRKIAPRLARYQEEMKEFTKFLKEKYFQER